MTDPKIFQYQGVGSGGPGGTHIYANLADRSPLAEQFALLSTLRELAGYLDDIRDKYPAAHQAGAEALALGTRQLLRGFQDS